MNIIYIFICKRRITVVFYDTLRLWFWNERCVSYSKKSKPKVEHVNDSYLSKIALTCILVCSSQIGFTFIWNDENCALETIPFQ